MSGSTSPFGQNEWLVEEMYRKFREDPSSVDSSWHEFLVDYSPEPATDAAALAGNGQPAEPAAPPEPKPAPEPAQAAKPAPPAKTRPISKAASTEQKAPLDTPAKSKAAAAARRGEGDEVRVLRGAAAAVVKNMNASLEVPTATSVRAIPAKLMIDNRVVINNQLKRTRGGKISFTHLHRLRARAGGQEVPEHEPPLRRGRRQARRAVTPANTSTSGWRSTCRARTATVSSSWRASRTPRR